MKTEEALALIDDCLAGEAVRWLEQDYERWEYGPDCDYDGSLVPADENGLVDTFVSLRGQDMSQYAQHSVRPMFEVLEPVGGQSAHWCHECADGELDMDLCTHGTTTRAWDGAGIRLDMATVDEAFMPTRAQLDAVTALADWQKTWSHFFFTSSGRGDGT